MDCLKFKSLYQKYTTYPLLNDLLSSDEFVKWNHHSNTCVDCSEWKMGPKH